MTALIGTLATALTAVVLTLSADMLRKFGISLYSEQYLAALMALAMPLLFLSVPGDRAAQARGLGALV